MVVTWKGFYWTAAPPERLPGAVKDRCILPFPALQPHLPYASSGSQWMPLYNGPVWSLTKS